MKSHLAFPEIGQTASHTRGTELSVGWTVGNVGWTVGMDWWLPGQDAAGGLRCLDCLYDDMAETAVSGVALRAISLLSTIPTMSLVVLSSISQPVSFGLYVHKWNKHLEI